MTEFTKEYIASLQRLLENSPHKQIQIQSMLLKNVIDEISRLQARVQDLENEKLGILYVLGEVVSEAYLQDPFGDDAGMALLHGARTLLETYNTNNHENINSNKII